MWLVLFWLIAVAMPILWRHGVRILKKEGCQKMCLSQELRESITWEYDSDFLLLRWLLVVPAGFIGFLVTAVLLMFIWGTPDRVALPLFAVYSASTILAFVPFYCGAMMAPFYRIVAILVQISLFLFLWIRFAPELTPDPRHYPHDMPQWMAFFWGGGCVIAIRAVYRKENGWRS